MEYGEWWVYIYIYILFSNFCPLWDVDVIRVNIFGAYDRKCVFYWGWRDGGVEGWGGVFGIFDPLE
jgi:hypothetical protein